MEFSAEVIVFIVYFAFILSVGLFFFLRNKGGGEKTYFLGGRMMGAWVSALSAGASDMSAWVLMGLPTSVYALGLGQVWISVGLAAGYALSWAFEAPRLRAFSIVAGDAITIPQYLTNRFLSKSGVLRVICAVVFLVAYTVYSASSIKACGTLFSTVINIEPLTAMRGAALIIICYTFLGGYSAVCWNDFFQGLLILASLMTAPLFAASMLDSSSVQSVPPEYWNVFTNWRDIISGLAWGLGYFGMPHIIIRYMSIKSQRDVKKSAVIGVSWTVLIVIFAAIAGVVGRLLLGYDSAVNANSLVFITMVRRIFPAAVSGVLLSAVLAASMSTADSQLLAAASSFVSDVYKPVVRKGNVSDREMLWMGRIVVTCIALLALMLASDPESGSIMSLVSNAWGVFGASFGPVIMLSLFWRSFNFAGASLGIICGAAADIAWYLCMSDTGIYELAPGFLAGLIAAVAGTLCTNGPSAEEKKLFDDALAAVKNSD